jgi:hypothetical protein
VCCRNLATSAHLQARVVMSLDHMAHPFKRCFGVVDAAAAAMQRGVQKTINGRVVVEWSPTPPNKKGTVVEAAAEGEWKGKPCEARARGEYAQRRS